jgi:hypothetical protein
MISQYYVRKLDSPNFYENIFPDQAFCKPLVLCGLFWLKQKILKKPIILRSVFPPDEKAVKKIKVFFVKETVLLSLAGSRFLEKDADFQALKCSAAFFRYLFFAAEKKVN